MHRGAYRHPNRCGCGSGGEHGVGVRDRPERRFGDGNIERGVCGGGAVGRVGDGEVVVDGDFDAWVS